VRGRDLQQAKEIIAGTRCAGAVVQFSRYIHHPAVINNETRRVKRLFRAAFSRRFPSTGIPHLGLSSLVGIPVTSQTSDDQRHAGSRSNLPQATPGGCENERHATGYDGGGQSEATPT